MIKSHASMTGRRPGSTERPLMRYMRTVGPIGFERLVWVALLLAIATVVAFFVARAAGEDGAGRWTVYSDNKPRPAGEPVPPLFSDPAALEAYVDRNLGAKMKEEHLVGAVFLAIKDGEVIFQRGYGVKDLKTGEPINPETDMFQVASISKTFLGTAFMRLVDQGKVSLDDSVANRVPSIELEKKIRFDERPVTFRDVLMHRSGFRDLFLNSTAPSVEKFEKIRPVIREYLNEQGAPPGEFYEYCNICISMAAAGIEEISGQEYQDWLQQQVFDPLNIKYAVLNIPGNERVEKFRKAGNFVVPYVYDEDTGEYKTYGDFIRNLYPPSSIAISANGMKNYMLMHMGNGMFNGRRFLSQKSYNEMHKTRGSNGELMPGFRVPFKEGIRNGVAYYGHSGDYRGTDSTMQFFPEYGFAFFLSYTGDNDTFYRRFTNDILDTAFPRQTETVTKKDVPISELRKLAGPYTSFRFDEPTPMQLVWPLFGQYEVSVTPDGLVKIDFPSFFFGGGPAIYAPQGDGVFRKVGEGKPGQIGELLTDSLVIVTDESGRGRAIKANLQNHSFILTRIPDWKSGDNFKLLLGFAGIGMAATAVLALLYGVGRLVRQRVFKREVTTRFWSHPAIWALVGASVAGIWFLGQFIYTLYTTLPVNLTYGFDDLGLEPVFILPIISLVLTLVALIFVVRLWVRRELGLIVRIVATLALLPLMVWVFLSYQSELLTFYF
ncbi:serine hydrolase [Sphingosinicella microcystinivorans]|uniref:CubicO group peptidase (Beta-lactamase class C family) n=1 Tax=Sphingosinicella microcystinivorans TaxID=335406 RepID=A0AAD1G058_SPHMI|nr:serine hydrolase [Sphingosinicella microcystinivorans]RKS85412.1 CubicO group peptidase (beta-lactamase class C family) [Sphingosinicella microcystinivorans]BBE33299.1 hypothetical protein SmB9_09570 [Sphingosinicella microcystinivorans]